MDGKCLQLLYVLLHSWQTWELILFCCRSCDSSYVCIATASPAKFPEAIEKSGVTYVNPPEIQRLFQMPEKFEWMNVGQDWEMILRQKISTLAWKQKDDSKDNNLLGKYINVEFWHTVVWKENVTFHKCISDGSIFSSFLSISESQWTGRKLQRFITREKIQGATLKNCRKCIELFARQEKSVSFSRQITRKMSKKRGFFCPFYLERNKIIPLLRLCSRFFMLSWIWRNFVNFYN